MAIMQIRPKKGKEFTIKAILILRDTPWTVGVPRQMPSWLKDDPRQLADPDIIHHAGKALPYDVLMAGDTMALLRVNALGFHHTFALMESVAGWIPRRAYVPMDDDMPQFAELAHMRGNMQAAVMRLAVIQTAAQDIVNPLTLTQLDLCKYYAALEQDVRDRTYDALCGEFLARERVQFFAPEDDARDFKARAEAKLKELQEFMDRIQQQPDGRMVVQLPKDPNYKKLVTRNAWSANQCLQSTILKMATNPVIRQGLEDTKQYMVDAGVLARTTVKELDAVAEQEGRQWTELSFRAVFGASISRRARPPQCALSFPETTLTVEVTPPMIGSRPASTSYLRFRTLSRTFACSSSLCWLTSPRLSIRCS
jgi:hypothetical protein